MKKLFQAIAILMVFVFTSCNKSNDGWLKLTIWEADLAGRDIEGYGVLSKGLMRYKFNLTGYTFQCELRSGTPDQDGMSSGNNFMSQTQFSGEIEYKYPSVAIPYNYKDESGSDAVYFNEGTFTADDKTLHFDSFMISKDFIVPDVDFVRKW